MTFASVNRGMMYYLIAYILIYDIAADGFVVQTGDPEGPAEGFIDPSTEKTRTIPLEIMVEGEKAPFYESTLEVSLLTSHYPEGPAAPTNTFSDACPNELNFCLIRCLHNLQELGLYKAQTKLPFNAFGTMAMAREVSS